MPFFFDHSANMDIHVFSHHDFLRFAATPNRRSLHIEEILDQFISLSLQAIKDPEWEARGYY